MVHPQSVVHAMVELADGTVLMQAATPDMRIPIQAALTAPERISSPAPRLDLEHLRSLDFEPPERERWPCLELAFRAGRAGLSYPAALNAANEEAVRAFLAGGLPFTGIPGVVEAVLEAHEPLRGAEDLGAVLAADAAARAAARAAIDRAPAPVAAGADK